MAHHGAGQGGLGKAMQGLVTILSLIAMVFLAPNVWPLIEADTWTWLSQLYSATTTRWLHIAAMVATWPLTFLTVRLVLTMALSFVVAQLANRMI